MMTARGFLKPIAHRLDSQLSVCSFHLKGFGPKPVALKNVWHRMVWLYGAENKDYSTLRGGSGIQKQ